jgi:hypothetical protein
MKGEKTCIDCHKGIAHQLPDMRGVPGWDVTGTMHIDELRAGIAAVSTVGDHPQETP